MAVVWTIAGEAGKTVDEAPRSLAALKAQGLGVDFVGFGVSTMSWTIGLADADDSTPIPDLGQVMSLFRNGSRYFTGNVTGRRIRGSGASLRAEISVSDAWWWLTQIAISSEIPDQTTDASERTAYVFPTGSPRTNLIALIYRAIALGAPISEGPVASCFNVPRQSLRNIPLSESMAEVMRWVADGMVYFDYSGDGFPKLCMQRRDAAAVYTVNPSNGVVGDINLNPRIDLQVEELKVFYARRDTVDNKRLTVWDSQTAGALTSGLPRRQPALISGPEIDTYLPQDFTDSVVVRSAPLLTGSGSSARVVGALFEQYDERLRAANAAGFLAAPFTDPDRVGGPYTLTSVAPRITDADGNAIDPAYAYYLTAGESKDWWTKDGIEFVQARVTATIYNTVVHDQSTTPDPPLWYQLIGGNVVAYSISTPGGLKVRHVWSATMSVSVPLVKTHWTVDTTLIRSEDYAFVNPPDGLAANLLATQNWLPYEGTVGPIGLGEVPAGNAVGGVLNVSGFLPETANMRAMISGYSVSPRNGTVTYRVGPPDRFAYRDLVNRFRQSGADNIVWLVDSVSGDAGENPPPDPDLVIPTGPENSLTYVGSALTYDGDYLTFTP